MIFFLALCLVFSVIFLTQWVSVFFNISPVFSSGFITLIFIGIIVVIAPEGLLDAHPIESLVFGASFVGMSSKKLFRRSHILVSSIVYIVIFYYLTPLLPEVGGALGASAFVSVVVTLSVINIFKIIANSRTAT